MVEELLSLDFHILGVITPHIKLPEFGSDLSQIIPIKKEETLKLCLLENIDLNNLSTKDFSKLQLAHATQNKTIILYDFSRGLNQKEITYFNNFFKKIVTKYHKKIILISRDVNYLASICDTFAVYDRKIIYSTHDILDNRLYEYIDMPHCVRLIKLAQSKGINLNYSNDVNELIKDIYRRKNESKTDI